MSLASTLTDSLIYYLFCALMAVSATVLFGVAVNLARSAYPRRLRRFLARCMHKPRSPLPTCSRHSRFASAPFNALQTSHMVHRPYELSHHPVLAVPTPNKCYLGGFCVSVTRDTDILGKTTLEAHVKKVKNEMGTGNTVVIRRSKYCSVKNCDTVSISEGNVDINCDFCRLVEMNYVRNCHSMNAKKIMIENCGCIEQLDDDDHYVALSHNDCPCISGSPMEPHRTNCIVSVSLMGVLFEYNEATQTLVTKNADHVYVTDTYYVQPQDISRCDVSYASTVRGHDVATYHGMENDEETFDYCDKVTFYMPSAHRICKGCKYVPATSNTMSPLYHAVYKSI
jgi:hypothetical protein